MSQEVLAEQSGVSLRTIQRVEQGETVPRGHTVQALAAALQVSLEDLRHEAPPTAPGLPAPPLVPAPALIDDPEFLQLLNLSALSFLVLPFLNLVVPWLLWRARRYRTAHVAALGRRVLGFQLLWQVASFFVFLLAIVAQVVARHFQLVVPGIFLGVLVLTYVANALTVVYYQRQLRRGRLDLYRYRL